MNGMLALLLGTLVVVGIIFLRRRRAALAAFIAVGTLPLLFGSVGGALIASALCLSVLLAQPLFVVLGVVTLACYEFLSTTPPIDYGIFPEKMFELTDKNVLLAIPFFVVSGNIMTRGGIARALINLAKELTAFLPGGMAISAIGGCVMFAAISGSSPVTVIAIGSMMYPALIDAGFGERPTIGLLTSAGSLGIVIPPSIPMIIYAIVVSGRQVVDVGDLFLAGVGPGLLIGLLLTGYVVTISLRRSTDLAADVRRMLRGLGIVVAPLVLGELSVLFVGPWGHALGPLLLVGVAIAAAPRAFVDGFWALMLPIVILGGIYTGFFTPTEAAAVAVVYSLVAAIYIYRELSWKQVPPLVIESTIMMGALIVIMVVAFVFNDYLVEEQIPDQAVAWIQSLDLSRAAFLIALNVFLLVVGCFMDIMSAILIVVPLVVPMAMAPGIDINPVHLGIIFIVNLEIGYLTPPLGLNLFVASTLFRKPLGEVVRAVVPYTLLLLVGVLCVTYIPSISLGGGRWLREVTAAPQEPGDAAAPAKAAGSDGEKAEVHSIEELMNQADDDEADEADEGTTPAGKVLSIEELMHQADDEQDVERDDDE